MVKIGIEPFLPDSAAGLQLEDIVRLQLVLN